MALNSDKPARLERDPENTTKPARRQAARRTPRKEAQEDEQPPSKPPMILLAVFLIPLVLLGLYAAFG